MLILRNGMHQLMQYAKMLRPKIPSKDFASMLFLTVNSFIWYTLTYSMFSDTLQHLQISVAETLVLYIVYFGGAGCSALLGSVFFLRGRRIGFFAWIAVGVVATLLLTSLPNDNAPIRILICITLGVSIGCGLPSCLAYFADATAIEHRGVYGGIIWAVVGPGAFVLNLFANVLGSFTGFLVLAVWRALALIPLLRSTLEHEDRHIRKASSYGTILRSKQILLYLVPWIMFSIVNFAEAPILNSLFGSSAEQMGYIEFALIGVFALVGGLFADVVGRKRVIITGFVMFGVGYALLSLLSGNPVSWYLYTFCDGIAWGMFFAVFIMALWGDLAGDYGKEKFYAIGGLPYLLAGFLPILIEPKPGTIVMGATETVTAFSLASFFLFLAVLPLMYAPETLPEKRIREMELKGYLEKAKKVKEKYT
jgi:MFS family permease